MFKGKSVLVTGASGGIGQCIAKKFAEEGAKVAIHYNSNKESAEAVKKEIEAMGGLCEIFQCDIRDNGQVKEMIDGVVEKLGGLDVLVNNAGVALDARIHKMPEDYFDKTMAINVKGTWNATQHAVPLMTAQGSGAIINISSISGVIGNIGQSAYSTSKAGVIAMAKTVARETASKGVRVNAVAPGFIEVGMSSQVPEKLKEKLVTEIPMGRTGKGEEIADAVLFLASDKASYITGQVLQVNGGWDM